MKFFISTISCLTIMSFAMKDISMNGLKIGDNQNKLANIQLEIVAKEDNMTKFKTKNGNDLSITCQNGKIVFMENDWLQDTNARQPLYSDFQFGLTSLRDIRKKFSTNGFAYKSRGTFATEDDLIQFNCFEFDSPNNEILVVITKVPLNADVTEDNVADQCKLDAIIIADKSYLDKEWGKSKLYDPNYKKIKP